MEGSSNWFTYLQQSVRPRDPLLHTSYVGTCSIVVLPTCYLLYPGEHLSVCHPHENLSLQIALANSGGDNEVLLVVGIPRRVCDVLDQGASTVASTGASLEPHPGAGYVGLEATKCKEC